MSPSLDTLALNELLDQADELNPNVYATEVWSAIQMIKAEARKALSETDVTQKQIDLLTNVMRTLVQAVNVPAVEPAKTGWQQIQNKWYFFETSGKMVTGWKKLGTWYYFGSDGEMKTGWQQIQNKWYFFETSGKMVTGWKKLGKWYYFGSNGAMKTGWYQVGKSWYFSESSGKMVTGWKKLGKWYYFGSDGEMKTGWLRLGKSWYYFNQNGKMATNGIQKIGSRQFHFNAQGICTNP